MNTENETANPSVAKEAEAKAADGQPLSLEAKIELTALKCLSAFGDADKARANLSDLAENDPSYSDTVHAFDAFHAGQLREYLAHKAVPKN